MSIPDLIVVAGGQLILVIYIVFVAINTRPGKVDSKVEIAKDDEDQEWKEIGNFSWLDTCPSCGTIDNHPFQTIEKALDEAHERGVTLPIKLVTEDVHLPVVERTCTNTKCKFKWFQH